MCKNVNFFKNEQTTSGFEPPTSRIPSGRATTELRRPKMDFDKNMGLYRQWESFPLPFPPSRSLGIQEFCLVWSIYIPNFMLKPKNARFRIFVGDMMYRFLSYTVLNSNPELVLCTLEFHSSFKFQFPLSN